MDFADNPAEALFREAARSWLAINAPSQVELHGLGELERARLWQKRKYDAGWACITWPREFGGRGGTAIEQVIWEQEEARFELPPRIFLVGHGMAAPTLMTWGSDAVRKRFLPGLASGEEIWCQLFSEPAGGSDLAALRTRAVRAGNAWVVDGQKTWTSRAQYADFGILVVRTDPTLPKHRGLTYFYVDMKSPGIEIRPIRQITGESSFNEVYFDSVRIHDDQRIGAVGQGWEVALTTLMNERLSIGQGDKSVDFDALFRLACNVIQGNRPAISNPAVRARLADWFCQEAGLRYTEYRALTALSRGGTPGPENSIAKLVGAAKAQDMAAFAIDLLAEAGIVSDAGIAWEGGLFQRAYLGSPGVRIAGGTDEILANIIAERVLGLPQDVRVDKAIPFDEVPTASRRR